MSLRVGICESTTGSRCHRRHRRTHIVHGHTYGTASPYGCRYRRVRVCWQRCPFRCRCLQHGHGHDQVLPCERDFFLPGRGASNGVRELTASRRCRDLAVLFRTSPDGGIVRNTFGSSGVLRRRRCLFGIGRPEDPEVLECQNCARCSGLLRRTTRSKDWRFSTSPAVPINENAVMSLVARDFREPVQFPEGGMVVGMPKDFESRYKEPHLRLIHWGAAAPSTPHPEGSAPPRFPAAPKALCKWGVCGGRQPAKPGV